MKRFFNLKDNTFNNYCDDIDPSYMVEIPDDGKPYGIANGAVVDISKTNEYTAKMAEQEKALQITNLQSQIDDLDKKRIRAGFEPSVKDESTGQTWLEYYNLQIADLREQISQLN